MERIAEASPRFKAQDGRHVSIARSPDGHIRPSDHSRLFTGTRDSQFGDNPEMTDLVDELPVDIMPVFLGIGVRLFESSSLERVRLEKINVQEVGARTSLRSRVKQ